ncbi:MAG: hypothetical protein DRG78_19295 [Epsilonproteobacteria bacterium]|nr:MAG: hypothetical protein DRG78_19295 [Campylobacterota bacterium]
MNKKQLVTIKIKDLIEKVGTRKPTNDNISYYLNRIVAKSYHLHYLIKNIMITISVNNINKANMYFTNNDILFIENKNHYELLALIFNKQPSCGEETIDILFIENKGFDNKVNELFSYIIDYPQYYYGIKTNDKYFQEIFATSKLCTYFEGTKKCIIKTLLEEDRTPHRIGDFKEIKRIKKQSSIKDKYINLLCPVCTEKYEITKETIDKIIVVDKKANKITFDCIHKKFPEFKSKFSISLKDYEDYISLSTKEYTIQMWFIDNFKRLTNEDK